MSSKVAITGVGFVTKRGFTRQSVWEALCSNDESDQNYVYLLEQPYDLESEYRNINPCSYNGVNAAEKAWEDAFSDNSKNINLNYDHWGVYSSTNFGGFVEAELMQCQDFIEYGPQSVFPGFSLHGGYHATADIVAIRHRLGGANMSFASGRVASGMALLQAVDDIAYKKSEGLVVLGTESIHPILAQAYEVLRGGSRSTLSSGACSVILQHADHVAENKSKVRCLVEGVSAWGIPGKSGIYSPRVEESLIKTIEDVLKEAGIDASDVDLLVSMEGNSSIEKQCYQNAYEKVFMREICDLPIVFPKRVLGDSMGANAILGVGVGVLCIEKQEAPIGGDVKKKIINHVLVTADDPSGSAWAILLKKDV